MDRLNNLLNWYKCSDFKNDRMFLSGNFKVPYTKLRDNINKTINLFEEYSLKKGDCVSVASHHMPAVAYLYFAALLRGVVLNILDPDVSGYEANILIGASGSKIVFADSDFIDRVNLLIDENRLLVHIEQRGPRRNPFGVMLGFFKDKDQQEFYPAMLGKFSSSNPDEVELTDNCSALILFTSGTTSTPKGVVLSRGALASQMEILMSRLLINNKSKILNHLPIHHSDGLNQGLLLSFVAAAELVVPESINMQSIGDVLDICYKKKISHFITVPTVIAMICRLDDEYTDSFSYPEFKVMESTAGYLNSDLWSNFEKRFGVRITNCYGLTETVCEATYAGPDDESHKIGTVGKPDGFEIRLISDDGNDVGQGEVGELLLKGDGLFSHYFNNPKATEEVFLDGWFRTGDLATISSNNIVSIVGRKKNVIIRSGVSIFPEDINFYALRCEGISDVVTVGLPDELIGERVVVVATSDSTNTDRMKELLFNHLRTLLPAEKQPDDIYIFDQFPFGPSGKVDLKTVIQKVNTLKKGSSASNVLGTVIQLAATAFGVPESSITAADNPDSIPSWDSLRFLSFIMLLEKEFDFQFSTKDVININNLYDASEIIKLRIK